MSWDKRGAHSLFSLFLQEFSRPSLERRMSHICCTKGLYVLDRKVAGLGCLLHGPSEAPRALHVFCGQWEPYCHGGCKVRWEDVCKTRETVIKTQWKASKEKKSADFQELVLSLHHKFSLSTEPCFWPDSWFFFFFFKHRCSLLRSPAPPDNLLYSWPGSDALVIVFFFWVRLLTPTVSSVGLPAALPSVILRETPSVRIRGRWGTGAFLVVRCVPVSGVRHCTSSLLCSGQECLMVLALKACGPFLPFLHWIEFASWKSSATFSQGPLWSPAVSPCIVSSGSHCLHAEWSHLLPLCPQTFHGYVSALDLTCSLQGASILFYTAADTFVYCTFFTLVLQVGFQFCCHVTNFCFFSNLGHYLSLSFKFYPVLFDVPCPLKSD